MRFRRRGSSRDAGGWVYRIAVCEDEYIPQSRSVLPALREEAEGVGKLAVVVVHGFPVLGVVVKGHADVLRIAANVDDLACITPTGGSRRYAQNQEQSVYCTALKCTVGNRGGRSF